MANDIENRAADSPSRTVELDEPLSRGPWNVELTGPGARRVVTLTTGQTLIIGSRPDCGAVLGDPTVSGRHAKVSALSSGLVVEDLGSKNGVWVGGARVGRALLRSGQARFVVGRTQVSIHPADGHGSPAETALVPGLVGSSGPMRRLAAEVRRIATLDAPVLLQGESGTGKDVIARAIHVLSGRRGRYVPLNAGGLGEALADSELFGHCRGAFTGAVQARSGAFVEANGGTLFLDEVGDLVPAIQVKLLRAVEDGEIRALGAQGAVKVQPRIVAATWASLEQRIEKGSFRADLYHRLATFVIRVPPLRQRKSDIPELARVLLASKRSVLGEKRLSSGALDRLGCYSFPGNVRELFSILYRAAALCDGSEIGAMDIEAALPIAEAAGVRT
ncbi:MAG TPA: sigma 54-interacting transcriptional regulator, partial [Polyangiaceae bacterium]|nr:sigma 54-interacting transcriptional regulator [Polyangiaceae bacterium]